ncbi:hypothetical protein L1987_08790 [Smallanthus sonchifolius]|uniref:Uncharacterized protein n=1 Tax=Smallanthus sonchifolius TaxID=185202 RepID=A0ACB9JL76_9ASTR|nr:hypothetical protein L1987_08790 [Smallanthus sonchifolius]
MEKDDEISKVKKRKVKSLALKAKYSKSSSEKDNEQSNSDNGEELPKATRKDNKNNAFVGGAWSDNWDENDEAKKEKKMSHGFWHK